MKKYPKNFGLLPDDRQDSLKEKDYKFGAISGVSNQVVLQTAGHGWKSYLPPLELQYGVGFDTYGCVSFSAWKCVTTLIARKYGLHLNKSERFTVKLSGTTPGQGNSLFNVAESIRKTHGGVDQDVWPFPNTDAGFSLNDFYATVPPAVLLKGRDLFKQFKIQYEFVPANPADMISALQYAPLQVTGFAWPDVGSDGKYHRIENTPNHAFELYDFVDGKEWNIYDQYDNDFKRLSWDFKFGSALKFDVQSLSSANMAFLQELLSRGLKYIQRPQAQGQVYKIDPAGFTFLDVKPDSTGHVPLYDEAINDWKVQGKITGISESDYQRLITP